MLIELLGGKETLTTKTWDGLNAEQKSSTLHDLEKPLKTKMKKTLQDELLKVHCPHFFLLNMFDYMFRTNTYLSF
jgi:hypothetical protein